MSEDQNSPPGSRDKTVRAVVSTRTDTRARGLLGKLPRKVGGFTLLRELGRGGMGVIFEAEDEQLARRVAIKALPAALAVDPAALERFKREARILASMNHPSIGAIYGIEEFDSHLYLILELIGGETLGKRLSRGALTLAETVEIFRQIATSLEGAHDRGVIHRDLKPENVMITEEGKVKVVDFGLAKNNLRVEPGQREVTRQWIAARHASAPTEDEGATAEELAGTPAYMSPEQVECAEIDVRADIWALGCLLFECLAGRRAYPDTNLWAVLAQILGGEPDWAQLPHDLPVELEQLVRSCLDKEIDRRPASLAEFRRRLEASVVSLPEQASTTNLPAATSRMIGREDDVREVRRLLAPSRTVTLTGTGGCGKTMLATELGRLLVNAYEDGVWLVELDAITEPSRVATAVIAALRLEGDRGRDPLETLVDGLRDKQALVVIDNCEHVLRACSTVITGLLTACAGISVLATSRESLGIPGELTYRVPSLRSPRLTDSFDIEDIERFPAVRLFVERARAVCPGLELDTVNSVLVLQICSQLDGIPLAIELAAARAGTLSLEEIARLLNDRFRLLVGGQGTALPRQQTLRALVDWSYDQLSAEEQSLLRALGVFRGGFSLQAAVSVHGGEEPDEFLTLDLLTRLVDKSLVQTEERENVFRYRLLESIRQYALDRLVETGEAADMRGRHLRVFAELTREAASHFDGPAAGELGQRLEREHENLLEALRWAAGDPGLGDVALEMALSLAAPWAAHGHLEEGREILEATLANVPDPSPHDQARCLDGLARFHLELGDLARARASQERAVSAWRELCDPQQLGMSLSAYGNVLWRLGDLDAAETALEGAMTLTGDMAWTSTRIGTVRNLAIVAYRRGDLQKAHRLIGLAITQARAIHDDENLSASVQFSGEVMMRLGRYSESRELHEEAMQLMVELGFKSGVAMQLINLGHVALAEGDLDEAEARYNDALLRARQVGRELTIIQALNSLGECMHERGDHRAAIERYEQALRLCRKVGQARGIARALERLSSLAVETGDLAAARAFCAERVRLWHEHDVRLELGVALRELAALALQAGDAPEAARLTACAEAAAKGAVASLDELVAPPADAT